MRQVATWIAFVLQITYTVAYFIFNLSTITLLVNVLILLVNAILSITVIILGVKVTASNIGGIIIPEEESNIDVDAMEAAEV